MQEIERIRAAAMTSIGRACLFFMLAVGTVMAGLTAWPYLAFKSGAILTTLLAMILTLRATLIDRQDIKRTETWFLLRARDEKLDERARRMIAGVLQETYRTLALYAALIAVGCWMFAFAALLVLPQAVVTPRTLV
ncbi:MAG: hypothetical protein J0H39_15350 [Alphaproteobacteria bacterium]|nr:hypothetical protein [Alphaproteobacteria bacterium]